MPITLGIKLKSALNTGFFFIKMDQDDKVEMKTNYHFKPFHYNQLTSTPHLNFDNSAHFIRMVQS